MTNEIPDVEAHLRLLMGGLPKSVRMRFESCFDHFERSGHLLDIDREMASFRAITGEEEAATALMRAIQLKGYEGAARLNPWRHHHKAAIVACVAALGQSLLPVLKEFQLQFNFERTRIDIKVPLSNFGVVGGEGVAIQPVEPLGIVHSRVEGEETPDFAYLLKQMATDLDAGNVRKLINNQANRRNRLLYASDEAMPISQATRESIGATRNRALALLVLSVMVLQAEESLPLVRQSLATVLTMI